MPMNRVQFQPGLSLPEFLRSYATERACERALQRARWRTVSYAHGAMARR